MKEEKEGGNALSALLSARMRIQQLSITELAGRLGISQGYLSQLLPGGKKDLSSANDDLIRRCAEFLHLPGVVCFLLAGKLNGKDFYEPTKPLKQQLAEALLKVAECPKAVEAAVSYECLIALPEDVQHFIVLLYEEVELVEILEGRVKWSSLGPLTQPRVPFSVRRSKA